MRKFSICSFNLMNLILLIGLTLFSCTSPIEGEIEEDTSSSQALTVNFNNGEEILFSQTVSSGSVISRPPVQKKSDYVFDGWYKNGALTDLWTFGGNSPDIVTQDITLYAKWTEVDKYWDEKFHVDYDYDKGHVNYVIKDEIKKEMQEITIPDFYLNPSNNQHITITKIENGVFDGCASLTTVTIPDSVTEIGRLAFRHSGLTSITLPAKLTKIEDEAFAGCASLTTVTIPDSVTEIGRLAFHNSGLTSITLPAKLTRIEEGVFDGCASLTAVMIPDSVTEIGRSAFHNSGLTSITLPASLTKIEDEAFAGCASLTITIPDSVVEIGPYTFYNSGKNIILPEAFRFFEKDGRRSTIKRQK